LHEQTHEKLIAMKLFGMANALKDRLERRRRYPFLSSVEL
jgi:hypothetical protein